MLGTSVYADLWFKDMWLGTYVHANTAAESISKGEHDAAIGLKASALGVPADFEKWNGLR